MKKTTREMVENVVREKSQKVTEHVAEMLIENVANCIDNHKVFEDKSFANQLTNTMIPISTAYQMVVYTMINVLCELLCEEEKAEEPENKINEIVLIDGQSLTVKKDNQRIEISDDGVMVTNGKLELNK